MLSVLVVAAWFPDRALALGTPAGTDIVARATLTYTMSGTTHTGTSNDALVRVDEVIDFAIVWQDADAVETFPGETGRALAYRVQNTGNGTETFLLAAISALAGDDFDPDAARVFLDRDGNGRFESGDEAYARGVNDPTLPPDRATVVFVVADIPADSADGATGHAKLVVTAGTGVGAPGTVVIGAGDDGTNAVLGAGGGFGERTGTFAVVGVELELVKSAAVADPDGGGDPRPGAVITYTIVANVAGAGTARGVVVSDAVPPPTVYVPGSLSLNGAAVTDAADGDPGDFGITKSGTLTIRLGDLTAASPPQEIAFQVTVP
jgi:uncharacterized repeat protein (TIGR01451 family)